MSLRIIRDDITGMKTEAIVNAANRQLLAGGGVCGAIFQRAGHEKLSRACRELGGCETGEAVMTPGFNLPASYVIHTPGPVWQGGDQGEAALLKACYENALSLAKEKGLKSLAFPLISSGIYGYPPEQALDVAVGAIDAFLKDQEMDVWLVLFDQSIFQLALEIYPALCGQK